MAHKRINKKAAVSFTVIFLSMVIGFVVINGAFNFMMLGENYGVEFDNNYSTTFSDLNESQKLLDDTIVNVTESVKGIEVQQGVLQTFWNSFKGLGAILQLPLPLINVATNSMSVLLESTTVFPGWVQTLLLLAIITLIALSIVAAMTGGNSNV